MKTPTKPLIALIRLLIVALWAAPNTPCVAQCLVDQSNLPTPTSNFTSAAQGIQFGQSFTVGVSGIICGASVYVEKRGAPAANLTVELQGVAGGLPNGIVRASASLAPNAVVNGLNFFDFSGSNVVVANGEVCVLVVKSQAVSGNDYLVRMVYNDTYAGGQAADNFGSGWELQGPSGGQCACWDAIFQTQVNTNLPGPIVGNVLEIRGEVKVRHPDGSEEIVKAGDPVRTGDTVITSAAGEINLQFADNTTVTFGGNTEFAVNDYHFDPGTQQGNAFFNWLRGAIIYTGGLLFKDPSDNVEIDTPVGSLGIRGTEFIARRDPCSVTNEIYLIHGQLAIKPKDSGVTNVVDAPASIFYDSTNITVTGLTQGAYDALKLTILQTNELTFGLWQMQYFGCTNNNPLCLPEADPDGDGQNNHSEFLTRTDPMNNASAFRLLSITQEGSAARLQWSTHGGITNVLQASSSPTGAYSNISPYLIIPGAADVITNYLDLDAATNNEATRFYRVKLVL